MKQFTVSNLNELLLFLNRLEKARIHFSLSRPRTDAIMVEVAVPGERWEVEFFENGDIEIEIFKSNGAIFDGMKLDELFARFTEP